MQLSFQVSTWQGCVYQDSDQFRTNQTKSALLRKFQITAIFSQSDSDLFIGQSKTSSVVSAQFGHLVSVLDNFGLLVQGSAV